VSAPIRIQASGSPFFQKKALAERNWRIEEGGSLLLFRGFLLERKAQDKPATPVQIWAGPLHFRGYRYLSKIERFVG